MAESNPFARTPEPGAIKVSRCVKVTQDLSARMRVYQQYINFSAIAVTAWESALRDIEASEKADVHDRVMDGLGKTLSRLNTNYG